MGTNTGSLAAARLATLRELRAEIQDIQTLLENVQEGKTTIAAYAPYIEQNKLEVNALLKRLAEEPRDEAVLPSDSLGHLSNLWLQLLCSSLIGTPQTKIDAEEQVKQLASCIQRCSEMVAQIGNLTIPARLNDILANSWAGYLLSFHDLFGSELPRAEDRLRLLRFLASSPGLIENGIVEPDSGLIFPFHRQLQWRLLVCISLALLFAGVTGGIYLVGHFQLLTELTKLAPYQLLLNWLLVGAGVLVHLAIARSKSSVIGAVSIPVSHLSAAIDARAGTILLKIVLMLFGYFGLLFLGGAENNGHLNAFLVGYSLDSSVGIVANALDKKASVRGTALARSLGE